MKNSPAYGRWNVQIVTAGTGEALPGPVALRAMATGSGVPYNRLNREVGDLSGGASEAAILPIEPSGHHNRR